MKKITFLIYLISIVGYAQITTTDVVTGFSYPYALALNENELFISDTSSGILSKIDITLATPIASEVLTGIVGINGLAIKGNYLYFSDLPENKISKIDITLATPIVTDVVTGINKPVGLAFKGNELFIAEWGAGKISKIVDITATTITVVDVLTSLNLPTKLAFKDNELYFSLDVDGKISKIEDVTAATLTVTDVVAGLTNPVGIVFKGNDLYITEPKNNTIADKIYKIDVTDNNPTLTEIITGVSGPRGVVFSGDVLYIAEASAGKVSKFNVSTLSTGNTLIPDANFEQALIDLGLDTTIDGVVLTTNISSLTSLNVNSKNITDLTGIADFTALTDLRCESNQLTSLDVSKNAALTMLYCHSNQLTSLDVRSGSNTVITSFKASNNPNLTCILVDDADWSTTNWTNIDATSTFVNNETECTALSIADNTLELGVSVYPNPTGNTLFIEGNKNPISVSIYNVLGKEVISTKNPNNIDVKALPSGVYTIRISDGVRQTNRKFIKN